MLGWLHKLREDSRRDPSLPVISDIDADMPMRPPRRASADLFIVVSTDLHATVNFDNFSPNTTYDKCSMLKIEGGGENC